MPCGIAPTGIIATIFCASASADRAPVGRNAPSAKHGGISAKKTSVDSDKVVQMRKQGIGVRAIAEHFACTTGWIYVLLGEAGMTNAAQQRKKEQEEKEKKDE